MCYISYNIQLVRDLHISEIFVSKQRLWVLEENTIYGGAFLNPII